MLMCGSANACVTLAKAGFGIAVQPDFPSLRDPALAYIPIKDVEPLSYGAYYKSVTGKLMLKLFGEVWWDYNEKPCNYKGIICLESTIAWGFYAIIIVTFLHERVLGMVDRYDMRMGIWVCRIIFFLVTMDYLIKLMQIFNISLKEQKDRLMDAYEAFRARWY